MKSNLNNPQSFSWGRLITDMKLQGFSAMIACHTEPTHYDADASTGPLLRIQVNEYLREISDSPAMMRLSNALKDYFGESLSLEISFGPALNSPAAIAFDRRVGRYTSAYSNIAQDDVVAKIIQEFGAKIIVESVHPTRKISPQ